MIKAILRRIRALRPRTGMLAGLGAATIFAAAACDGDNLFEGRAGTGGGPPRVVSLTVPAQASENSRVDVRVRVLARRGLAQVNVRFRGATTDDQEFPIQNSPTDTVVVDAFVDLPVTISDSILAIEAYATDVTGAVSEIVADTVRILDASAPTVVLQRTGDGNASVGGIVELHVTASDPFGLRQLGYAFVDASQDTVLTALFNAAGSQRDTTFRVLLPSNIQPGELTVVAIAVNQANLRGVSSPLSLTLVDQQVPFVNILEPAQEESLPIRDSVRVRVHVRDSSGLANIQIEGISFRNFPDTTQNSSRRVRFPAVSIPLPQGPDRPLPRDTVVFRFLKPNADTVSESIYFIVTATDVFDNVGVDTVKVNPGPRVVILNPATGTVARLGGTIPVRVTAHDPSVGIDSVHLYISGLFTDTIKFAGLAGARDPVERSTLLNVGGAAGTLQIRAAVWNTQSIRGFTATPVEITVSDVLTGAAPKVRRVVNVPQRVELADSIQVRVIANDVGGTGITRLGAVVIAIPGSENPGVPRDTFFFTSPTLSPPQGGTPDATFNVVLRDGGYNELMASRFPVDFTFQVHAFAVDAQGRCGASVQTTDQDLACQDIGNGYFLAQGQTGQVYTTEAVIGTSRKLEFGSIIADALPDTTNRRLYLSNFGRNRVDVLEIGADTSFRTVPLPVGSQPWGLFLAPGAGVDTLMVGNSGGTNISFVPTSTLLEDAPKRLLTPNEVLFNVRETVANGYLRYYITELEFSDRPQFVAQDRNRNILYSTRPTGTAVEGTARYAPAPQAGQVAEPIILIPGRTNAIREQDDTWAIAHVDSVLVVPCPTTNDDCVVIFDHVPGRPDSVLISSAAFAGSAIQQVDSAGSDIFYARGAWNRAAVGFADTTYVAWSKDLSTVAFGEGDQAPAGRIMLWQAGAVSGGRLSTYGTYDLIANAAETVNGLALNTNGTVGVARGLSTTYFFTNDVRAEGQLRLNGIFAAGVSGGSGGAALHPYHDYDGSQGSNENTLAFVATSSRSIKIIDTFHYLERGEIFIRDNITGQLRASPPMPGINSGIPSNSCNYTVVQLFGVTNTQNVVMMNVRRRDIRNVVTGQPDCN